MPCLSAKERVKETDAAPAVKVHCYEQGNHVFLELGVKSPGIRIRVAVSVL